MSRLRTSFPVSGGHTADHGVIHGALNAIVNAADFATLNDAITEAITYGVSRIYAPKGTHLVNAATIGAAEGGLLIYGDGPENTLVNVSGMNPGFSFVRDGVGVRGGLRDMSIRPASGQTPAGAVYLENSHGVTLENLYIYNFTAYGIKAWGPRSGSVVSHNQIRNCRLHNNGTNIHLAGGANANTILGGAISGTAQSGTGILMTEQDEVIGPDTNVIVGVDLFSLDTAISLVNASFNHLIGVRFELNNHSVVLNADSHHNAMLALSINETPDVEDSGQQNILLMSHGLGDGGPKGEGLSRLRINSVSVIGDDGSRYWLKVAEDGSVYSEAV